MIEKYKMYVSINLINYGNVCACMTRCYCDSKTPPRTEVWWYWVKKSNWTVDPICCSLWAELVFAENTTTQGLRFNNHSQSRLSCTWKWVNRHYEKYAVGNMRASTISSIFMVQSVVILNWFVLEIRNHLVSIKILVADQQMMQSDRILACDASRHVG